MDKFQNKYRIQSTRLQNWDYRWAGTYFITICTQNREHYFGEIINGEMKLSSIGVIADILWHQIPHHAKNIELGAFVVMPNHIHGILVITENDHNDNGDNDESKTIGQQRFKNIGKNSVSSIIGSYKSAVTNHAHRLGFEYQWQSRFYDHIIRNDQSFQKISNYIANNPINWQEDKFFKPE